MRKTILLIILIIALLLSACRATEPASPEATVASPTATQTLPAQTPTIIPETAPSLTPTDRPETALDHNKLLTQLLLELETQAEAEEILASITETGDSRYLAPLIDILRWQPALTPQIGLTLKTLTGAEETPLDWFEWVEWAGNHPEIESFEDYDVWKSTLFSLIDPNFNRFVYPDVAVAEGSRLEEIVWGGVRVDGIPALDNPTMIDPAEADYLLPDERIFGVSINGDSRAYPARFLDWHEMFNDVVGGEPVSLAY